MSGGLNNERFRLQWNEFQSNITTAFKELRDDSEFFDVTLACDNNRQLESHKVILSACSPFFRSILRRNPHSHPLLYLKGIKYEDLLAVLNFMYHGEVNIDQSELNSFLTVAEDLQVKGLTRGGSGTNSETAAEIKQSQEHSRSSKSPSKQPSPSERLESVQQSGDCLEDEVRKTIKTEPLQSGFSEAINRITENDYGEDEYHHYEGPDYHEQNDVDVLGGQDSGGVPGDPYAHLKAHCTRAKEGGGYVCLVCTKKGRDMYQMRQHIESAHPHLSREYTCPMCGHILSSYMKWKLHTKKYHGKILNH